MLANATKRIIHLDSNHNLKQANLWHQSKIEDIGYCPLSNQSETLRLAMHTDLNNPPSRLHTEKAELWLVPITVSDGQAENTLQIIPSLNIIRLIYMIHAVPFRLISYICEECGTTSRSMYRCPACGMLMNEVLQSLKDALQDIEMELRIIDND